MSGPARPTNAHTPRHRLSLRTGRPRRVRWRRRRAALRQSPLRSCRPGRTFRRSP
jgi:hypothetical protein